MSVMLLQQYYRTWSHIFKCALTDFSDPVPETLDLDSLSGIGSLGWSGHSTQDDAEEKRAPGGMQFT